MTTEAEIKDYRPKVSPTDRDDLMALAGGLNFRITQPGTYWGEPSVRAFLAALAAAYRVDPGGAHMSLKTLFRENGLLPDRPTGLQDAASLDD